MRILIALDKFKCSLTAEEAATATARGLQRGWPEAEITTCPVADGGEGFTAAVVSAMGGRWVSVPVKDPHGRQVEARYGLIDREGHLEAVMEMSAASGYSLAQDLPKNPRKASTGGTGEMMKHAISQGARRILIGIGGSATNDGGSGMAAALGCQFLDKDDQLVTNLPEEWDRVVRIGSLPDLACEVVVACDVNNPLLGPTGATTVYGPQKGVDDIPWFEDRMTAMADMVARDLGCDHRNAPGAGAAGGLGFGLISYCNARLQPGFELVAELCSMREKITEADLVITGEGKLDAQTLHGKGPMGVAEMARELNTPVVGVGGMIEWQPELDERFDGLLQVMPEGMSIEEAIRRAGELLEEMIANKANWLQGIAVRHSNP